MAEFEPRQHHNSFCSYCLENMREGVYLDVNYEDGSSEALENLTKAGTSCHAAVMSFKDVDPLVRKLQGIDESLAENLEIESMLAFPHTEREMTRRRIRERLVI